MDYLKRATTAISGVALSLSLNSAFAAEMTLNDGFESNTISTSHWVKVGNKTQQVVNSPLRSGNYAVKMKIRRYQDRYPERTEIRARGHFSYGTEYGITFSVYVPSDWQYDAAPITIFNLHGVADKHLGEKSRNASLSFRLHKDRWVIQNRWDDEKVTTKNSYDGTSQRSMGSIQKGRWTDWTIRIIPSYKSNGILEVWRGNTRVYSRKGPNTYNDAKGPFMKMGLYEPVWRKNYPWKKAVTASKPKEHTLYFDAVKIAKGSGAAKLVQP